jgi:hypothetical protein
VTFDDAALAEIRGRYRELLLAAAAEKDRARADGRRADEARWAVFASRAGRLLGRGAEALAHAALALDLAGSDAVLRALALHAQAAALRSARRYDESLAALRAALEALPPQGDDAVRADVLLETAETALEAGLRADAEAALARGGALVHWLRDPRLLAWSLYLRSHLEATSPADLQLAAAYELARTVDCPELQWQVLWRLSERAEQSGRGQMRDDLTWNALGILQKLSEGIDGADAAGFWKQGQRRTFVDLCKQRHGPEFLRRLMLGGGATSETRAILHELGFDPASIPDFGPPKP